MIKKMKKIAIAAIAMLFIASLSLNAQDSATMKVHTFQIGFITPLSSNGLDSWNRINKFSINILAGFAGGIHGVEFSGLGSVLKSDLRGAQFSGLFNIISGNAIGAQFAGLVNINAGKVNGFQTSGLVNINADTTSGLQSGGLLNYASGTKVTQFSGFSNIVSGNNKGFQIAGFINIVAKKCSGAQVAGFFNYTGKLNGVQIGFLNYTDSLEKGVPIGFLSFVKNGYSALEIGVTETLYGVMSFKTGTRQFYNILSIGGGTRDGLSLFAWGYGVGSFIPVGKKAGISIDMISYQVNEGEWFTNQLNLLNKIHVTASWKFAKHLTIFAGLSWNAAVSDITDEYGDIVVRHIAPWSVFDETYDDHINVKMYPGISAGIRL
ncbi:MAG: hypothetical protein NT040_15175 [Bacteroidetes bacterium]|nr:hypothetical protein [Bacteroidota bacterium]